MLRIIIFNYILHYLSIELLNFIFDIGKPILKKIDYIINKTNCDMNLNI